MTVHPSTRTRTSPPADPRAATEHSTRVDLLGTPVAAASARLFVNTWCHDRAVEAGVAADLMLLASEAVTHAFRFRPTTASISVGWHDADLVCMKVEWRGGTCPPSHAPALSLTPGSIAVLDEITADWNYSAGTTNGAFWVIVDAAPQSARNGDDASV